MHTILRRRTLALVASLIASAALAQAPFPYQQPPQAIRDVLDARPIPSRAIDPTGTWLAVVEMRRYYAIDELSRPFLRLAGLRIDPASNSPQRHAHIDRLVLRPLASEAPERVVALPPGGDFNDFRFSPDGRRFVVARRTDSSTELWLGDVASGAVKRMEGIALQAAQSRSAGDALDFMGSDTLIALTVPAKRGKAPASGAPTGPTVQESFGRNSPEATYQDLLRNPADEALFQHYFTAEITRIDLKSGARKVIAPPAVYVEVSGVGSSKLLVATAVPPWSYRVPLDGFARDVRVIDLDGKVLRTLPKVAVRENVPVQGVVQGPRNYVASPLEDGAIYWSEALDEGDPRKKVPARDKLMRLAAPYTGEPVEIARLTQRLVVVNALEDGRLFVNDFDRDRIWGRTLVVDPGKPGADPSVLFDLSLRDRYNNPGSAVRRVLPSGRSVIRVADGTVLYTGNGASPKGDRPFLDRWTIATREKARLFEASETHYEPVVRVLDDRGARFVTSRESIAEPPNLVLHDRDATKPLTRFSDPTPQIRSIRKELVRYKRRDGVDLSFWLYRPADMKPGEKRPALLWAYPLEFTDPALAGQVTGSPNRFVQIAGSSPLFMVMQGFVVLDEVTMPVVGEPEKVNDTFIDQITMNAEAAIAKGAEMGVLDPARVAVGGHSYGAFMTANLLAHTDLFKTGIARSGAYNRTLTPFGFQSERRTLWEAPSSYLKLSPFMVADKLKEPILMIHGEADDNTGTFPEQSDRMFAALAGTGGTVRFVKLPAEAHGYAARESVGHTLWEMSTWLTRWLGDPRT